MKARTVLSIIFAALLAVSAPLGAQPVGWSVSEPRPLSELELPFVADKYFFANYSPSTAVVWVNGKATDVTVPPFSFRWVSFYVASKTRIEARANVVTDKGVKVEKLKTSRARTRDWRHYGWLFSQ